jgi:hypothetical protein
MIDGWMDGWIPMGVYCLACHDSFHCGHKYNLISLSEESNIYYLSERDTRYLKKD